MSLFRKVPSLSLLLVTGLLMAAGTVNAADLDTDEDPVPLSQQAGDATRGREIATQQERGHCILCHAVPGVALPKVAGNMTGGVSAPDIGPPLQGVGARLSVAQLRFRLIDASRLNPDTVMPPYYRTTGLRRVAPAYLGKPLLDAQEIEDVVAYLASLK